MESVKKIVVRVVIVVVCRLSIVDASLVLSRFEISI